MSNSAGFANVFHNWSHDRNKFSPSEELIRKALESLGLKKDLDWEHDFVIKFHKGKDMAWHYWPDFYLPSLRLDIEVDPCSGKNKGFHSTFLPYRYACIRRTRRLKQYLGIHTKRLNVPIDKKGVPKWTLEETIAKVSAILKSQAQFLNSPKA